MSELITRNVPIFDQAVAAKVRSRWDRKTKPTGSLGRLEDLAADLAGMTGQEDPAFPRKAILLAVADHGVARQGVSVYPAEVTPQMVLNFLAGGAGISVLARHSGAKVLILDVGVNAPAFAAHSDLLVLRQGQGTADFSQGAAMSHEQAMGSLEAGVQAFERLFAQGLDLLGTGDMGIGNTTASSALVAAILGMPVRDVTGRGTGLDAAGWEHKVSVIEKALTVNKPDAKDGMDLLTKLGGFEIGALAGAMIAAARRRVPVVLDGFISGAAALLAWRLSPGVERFFIASHQSVEIGHRHLLEALGLRAYLHLELRLGEGTGAALCMPLVDAACLLLRDMATFESAGVTDKDKV